MSKMAREIHRVLLFAQRPSGLRDSCYSLLHAPRVLRTHGKFFYINLTILILSSYPFTYSSGSYNYNSITICKHISTPPQPYQKIPHIYFLRSCPLPNLISILSPITIQFVFDVFVLYVLCNFYCTALLCYLVLWPQSWINSTTTTTNHQQWKPTHSLKAWLLRHAKCQKTDWSGYFVEQTALVSL